jgi:hypothetical protein
MTVLGDLRADIEIYPIRKGQLATFEVDDGFFREPAPCDGLLIETKTATIFVPSGEVARALETLQKDERRRAVGRAKPWDGEIER